MSIELTTATLNCKGLSSTEKHILTILSFRANEKNQVWSSIKRLEIDSALSRKTIEITLKKLRDKELLQYTGLFKGKSLKIPVYFINTKAVIK